ncbi:hypothetical protein MAIT1_00223 [Magnetofaba australis IT-1]|uniref:Uncharacterized protein n=2 Tax=Magnetofaba TaxID=1472292 RepID=A0A1Y2K8S2_9PROT|nr:hypothetical protein MAIT1_00223 [Magnetofaba australis IT-1]
MENQQTYAPEIRIKRPFTYDFSESYAQYKRFGLRRKIIVDHPISMRYLWLLLPVFLLGWLFSEDLSDSVRKLISGLGVVCIYSLYYVRKVRFSTKSKHRFPMEIEREGLFFYALEEQFSWDRVGFAWMERGFGDHYRVILVLKQHNKDNLEDDLFYSQISEKVQVKRNYADKTPHLHTYVAYLLLTKGFDHTLETAQSDGVEMACAQCAITADEDFAQAAIQFDSARSAAQFMEVINIEICRAAGRSPADHLLELDACLTQPALRRKEIKAFSNLRALSSRPLPPEPQQPTMSADSAELNPTHTNATDGVIGVVPFPVLRRVEFWSDIALLSLAPGIPALLLTASPDYAFLATLTCAILCWPLAGYLFTKLRNGQATLYRDGLYVLALNRRIPWRDLGLAWTTEAAPRRLFLHAVRGDDSRFWRFITGHARNERKAARWERPPLAYDVARIGLANALALHANAQGNSQKPLPLRDPSPIFISLQTPAKGPWSAAQLAERINREIYQANGIEPDPN